MKFKDLSFFLKTAERAAAMLRARSKKSPGSGMGPDTGPSASFAGDSTKYRNRLDTSVNQKSPTYQNAKRLKGRLTFYIT